VVDFKLLKKHCEENSALSEKVLDENLLYYAAAKNNLHKTADKLLKTFRQVTRDFESAWINLFKSQYIIHRIFKEGGLIHKYLNHSEIKRLPPEQYEFLQQQAAHPWRFSFSFIADRPAPDFYQMHDVFSDESYLLYSQGISKTLQQQPANLFFNLIGYSGSCWQSYGPIGAYRGFDPDDIFFFATELRPEIETEEDLLADVEQNPVPYMMLISGANYPITVTGDDQLVHVMAEYDTNVFPAEKLGKAYEMKQSGEIYRLIPKANSGPPHFPEVYFDQANHELVLSALTDRGFSMLIEDLNQYGFDLPKEPTLRVSPSMVTTAEHILNKKITLNEYAELFEEPASPRQLEATDSLNTLLQLALPDINAGKEPDIPALARKAGVDETTAREVLSAAMERIQKLRKG